MVCRVVGLKKGHGENLIVKMSCGNVLGFSLRGCKNGVGVL